MKYIVTVVRPERLQAVKEALFRVGVTGMTLSRVSGHGGEREIIEQYRGSAVRARVPRQGSHRDGRSEPFVEPTIQAILPGRAHRRIGDGKIFVQPLDRVIRIRSGEERRRGADTSHRRMSCSAARRSDGDRGRGRMSARMSCRRHCLGPRLHCARAADGSRSRALLWRTRSRTRGAQHVHDELRCGRDRHRAVGPVRLFARVLEGRIRRRTSMVGLGGVVAPPLDRTQPTIPHFAFIGLSVALRRASRSR